MLDNIPISPNKSKPNFVIHSRRDLFTMLISKSVLSGQSKTRKRHAHYYIRNTSSWLSRVPSFFFFFLL